MKSRFGQDENGAYKLLDDGRVLRVRERSQRVTTAPSGQRMLKRYPKIEIVCIPCFNQLKGPLVTMLSDTPAEIEREARTMRPNPWRTRN